MAAAVTERTAINSPLQNNGPISGSVMGSPYKLPDGPCNFRNLSIGGADPPRCGCQRFCDKSEYARSALGIQQGVEGQDLAGWCMCEHHACFHETTHTQPSGNCSTTALKPPRALSQRSLTGKVALPSYMMGQSSDRTCQSQSQAPIWSETYLAGGLGISSGDMQGDKRLTDSGLPDTAGASSPVNSDSIILGLPPIPSQCILPPDISSGDIDGHSQSFQSFPGSDGRQLITTSVTDSLVRPIQAGGSASAPSELEFSKYLVHGGGQGGSFTESATEIITPSPRASPDLGSYSKFDRHVTSIQAAMDMLAAGGKGMSRDSSHLMEFDAHARPLLANTTAVVVKDTAHADTPVMTSADDAGAIHIHYLMPHLQHILKHVSAYPTLSTKLENHEQRLDLLENISSSFAGAQEVQERFDLSDERAGEVESRVEELEKSQAAMNDMSSFTSHRRRLRHFDEGDSSMISQTSTDMISAAIDRTEFSARLQTIEYQLSDFHASALPSFVRPWKVEVVFLPFGHELSGIWSTIGNFPSQRSRQNSMAADNRTQTQLSHGAETQTHAGISSTENQSWEHMHEQFEGIDEWLVARACRQGSKVEERLRSRGLVKTIEVKGPSARDVQAAMVTAFGDLPIMASSPRQSASSHIPDSFKAFYGLQASWIPLRKLHKDSRLRFLDPSEMVTPAIWNFMFLSSGVVMRATGVWRLYVTQRDSYIQQSDINRDDWSWQKLRVLPRVIRDLQSNVEVREADALEACWEWDERLDPPPSVHSSFASQHSSLSIRRAPSQLPKSSKSNKSSSRDVTPIMSTTPTSVRPLSPLIERHRPFHMRTTSMPSIVPLKFSPPQGKRRIASFEHEFTGPTSPQSSPIRSAANLAMKRRRISRSPSRPRDTPRWSTGPPSPYCYEEHVEQKRGTTPFAYATPHSNVPYPDYRAQSLGPLAMDDLDYHGSTTDHISMNGEDDDLEEFDSDMDQHHQPEDDVFEGLEDEMAGDDSDQEQKALSIDGDDDASSDLSSQPSEYPSTQPLAMYRGNKGAFQTHIDGEESHVLRRHSQHS